MISGNLAITKHLKLRFNPVGLVRNRLLTYLFVLICALFLQNKTHAMSCDNGIANVRDFGASGNGTTDDSANVQNALNCLNDNGSKGVLYFPVGNYRFNDLVGLNSSGVSWIKIKGEDARLSQLHSFNTLGIFDFRSDQRTSRLVVEDLGFIASLNGNHSGTAINFDLPFGGDRHERSLEVRNVEIRGPNFDRGYFQNGIVGKGIHRALVDNVLMTGPWGQAANNSDRSENCFHLIDSYTPTIINSSCWQSINGINLEVSVLPSTVGTLPEGLTIAKNKLVHVHNGIRVYNSLGSTTIQEPEGYIKDNHINAERNGIWLRGKKFVFIRDNLMFRLKVGSVPGDPGGFYTDILLDASSDNIISNNIFHSPLADDQWIGVNRAAVRIWSPISGTGNISTGNIVDGNIFTRRVMFQGNDYPGSHAVWVQPRSTDNIIRELPANAIVTIASGTNTLIQ